MNEKLFITAYDADEWPMDTMYYATQNPKASNVLVLEAEELSWFLNTMLIQKIDSKNESEICLKEDDWIPIMETKKACIKIIEEWLDTSDEGEYSLVVDKLLMLFKQSIDDEQVAVCFIYQ